MDGVGRCRLEGRSLWVGKAEFDVRQLANHYYHRHVGPALKALQPPASPAEALWLAYVFSFHIRATVFEAVQMLMEVVHEELENEGRAGQPLGGDRGGQLPGRGPKAG